jgi:hypothetical protein
LPKKYIQTKGTDPYLPPASHILFMGYPPSFRGVYLSFGVTLPHVKHDPQNERVVGYLKKNLAKISSKTGILPSSVLFIEKPTYNG